MIKTLLLANFLNVNKVNSLKNYLKNNFNINEESIFFFETNDPHKMVATFKVEVANGEKLDVKKHFKNTVLVHKKGTTFYTINALNKLIERDFELTETENIDYKSYKVDWSKYDNSLILINKNGLEIISLNRILS